MMSPAPVPPPTDVSMAGRIGWLTIALFSFFTALFCLGMIGMILSSPGTNGRLAGGLTLGGMAIAIGLFGWWCVRKSRGH